MNAPSAAQPLGTPPEASPTPVPAPAAPRGLAALWGGWPGRVLRVALSLLPLWWLSERVAWAEVWRQARLVGALHLGAALLAAFGSYAVGCVRWRVMMQAYGAHDPPSLGALLRHNLIGGYFNVLPSGVAGDAVRGHRVRRHLPSLGVSYTVLFVERLTGLLGLCLVAGGAIAASRELQGDAVALTLEFALLGAFGLSSVVLFLPFALARSPSLRARVGRIPVAGAVLTRIPPAHSLAGPLLATALSVLTQGSVVLSIALLLRPIAPGVTLATCARVVPAVILFTYVPLTPGGLGQREAAFVYLFGLAGVSAAVATATSLMFFAITMTIAALGGGLLLAERAFGWERP